MTELRLSNGETHLIHTTDPDVCSCAPERHCSNDPESHMDTLIHQGQRPRLKVPLYHEVSA